MSATPEDYDLVILGSGSTAFAAALQAVELGARVAMTEWRTIGGTCVNRGCLPSKFLIEAARHLYEAAHPRYAALGAVQVPLNWGALLAEKDALVATYRAQRYERLLDDRMRIVYGKAHLQSAHEVLVEAPGEVHLLVGEHVLIATGSLPVVPALPGLAEVPYLTSDLLGPPDDPWGQGLRELPHSLLLLGGGYIACELGQMLARFGCEVTLVTRGATILGEHEPEIRSALTSILQEEGLRIITQASLTGVARSERGVILTMRSASEGIRHLEAERLLVATGRRSATQGLGLERAGVLLDESGAVRVDHTLRTSVPHIWAAGDVIGENSASQMATPVGAHDGRIAAYNALSGRPPRSVDHTLIPRAVFTDPPIAVVGLTDAQAAATGLACSCTALPMSQVPRAWTLGEIRGVIKMVIEQPTERVLGVSMLGASAAEVIHEAAMALRFGATLADFVEQLHVYPTMAEALRLVALAFSRDVSRLSCCAG
jgi:mercuric reductase